MRQYRDDLRWSSDELEIISRIEGVGGVTERPQIWQSCSTVIMRWKLDVLGDLKVILNTRDSKTEQTIGQSVRTTPVWTDCKRRVMQEILWAKAEHCPAYRTALMSIPQGISIHEDTGHRFWGGKAGCADNLGQLHMIIKKELHDKQLPKPTSSSANTKQAPTPNHGNTPNTRAHQRPAVCILGGSNTRYQPRWPQTSHLTSSPQKRQSKVCRRPESFETKKG